MSRLRRAINSDGEISKADRRKVVFRWLNWLMQENLPTTSLLGAVLHVAMCSPLSTICSREQIKYERESPIRLRFVPALIEVLMNTSFNCILRPIGFEFAKSLTAIQDSARFIASTIRSPVRFRSGIAIYCGEQSQNCRESAIRLRFVPALARLLTREPGFRKFQ